MYFLLLTTLYAILTFNERIVIRCIKTFFLNNFNNFIKNCSNICTHKQNCEIYKNDAKKFLKENKKFIPDPLEARYEHFKTKFKIIGKGFKTDHDRERTEAFRIRTNMPKINKQTDQYAFRLF